jgi:predicted RNA-binding protein with EMAP domain
MRALKITKLLNLITAGAAMGGIAIGGIYIGAHLNTKGDPQDDTRFDISSLNNSTLIRPFSGIPRAESLITCLTDQFSSLTSLNQLVITNINAGAQTFTLSAVSNSTYYMDNKSATIRWNVPPQDNDFTQITGGTFDIDLLI